MGHFNSLSSSFTINFVENEDGDVTNYQKQFFIFGGKLSYTPNNEKTILQPILEVLDLISPWNSIPDGSYAETSKPIKAYLLGDVFLNFNINKKYNLIFELLT